MDIGSYFAYDSIKEEDSYLKGLYNNILKDYLLMF